MGPAYGLGTWAPWDMGHGPWRNVSVEGETGTDEDKLLFLGWLFVRSALPLPSLVRPGAMACRLQESWWEVFLLNRVPGTLAATSSPPLPPPHSRTSVQSDPQSFRGRPPADISGFFFSSALVVSRQVSCIYFTTRNPPPGPFRPRRRYNPNTRLARHQHIHPLAPFSHAFVQEHRFRRGHSAGHGRSGRLRYQPGHSIAVPQE